MRTGDLEQGNLERRCRSWPTLYATGTASELGCMTPGEAMTRPDMLAEAIARCWGGDPPPAPSVANYLGPKLLASLRQLESAPPTATAALEADTLALLPTF